MLRELAPYFVVSVLISAVGGGLYGAFVISVLAVYGLIIVASVISLVGYLRWDLRHYG